MYHDVEPYSLVGELFLAGERVPPGVYKQIGTRTELTFDRDTELPSGSEGQVPCYLCTQTTIRLSDTLLLGELRI